MKFFEANAFVALLTLLPHLALTAPTAQAASTKNFYLVTCTSDRSSSYDAMAYYPDGPQSRSSQRPSRSGTVSRPPGTWEGVEREAKIYADNWFKSRIDKNAGNLKKGEIAGTGDFEGEPFVCFKADGSVLYQTDEVVCRQKYWCPSIDVSSDSQTGTVSNS
ncbi:hypothetical protein K469DRAFT_691722 [Zopfia rhizophila CBS 207.26]|uniref:Uncharacterized protein n=1 Tax=Zopfia rhizophila CBS 207.26 TaxID=1314779 RepID=A0A6A6DTX6_9PEZI|nr:hypothetical protein K469DRAFT_691722 [Zopfia rhizophila CBS 207.26]